MSDLLSYDVQACSPAISSVLWQAEPGLQSSSRPSGATSCPKSAQFHPSAVRLRRFSTSRHPLCVSTFKRERTADPALSLWPSLSSGRKHDRGPAKDEMSGGHRLLYNPLIFKLDWSVVGCSGSGGGGVPVLIQLFLYEMLQIGEVT